MSLKLTETVIRCFHLFHNTQSIYHPTHVHYNTPFMTYQPLHISAPRCNPQGVTYNKGI